MIPASRYATHNNYIGFKRIVHDALHPGEDAPPVPHADTWFPEYPHATGSDDPTARNTRNRSGAGGGPSADDSDDDIAIEREKTSLKCPITLLPFKDPVTSKKCPHSFEKEAILSMISQSGARVGGIRRGEGERAVKCPVCEKVREYFHSLSIFPGRNFIDHVRDDDIERELSTIRCSPKTTFIPTISSYGG